ncbi:MAG: hypothetical protein VYA30_09165 [Myxococcota bacterium]|nr:hypothetical protein [Myxococcota bacterium]
MRVMFWVACLGVIAGCSTDEPGGSSVDAAGQIVDGGVRLDGAGPTGCQNSEQCPAGQLCDEATAQCRLACNADADCGPGRICNSDNFCVETSVCDSTSDCAGGETCDCQNRCIPLTGVMCRGNLQCQADEYCDVCAGQCRSQVGQCGACFGDNACDSRSVCVGYRDEFAQTGRPPGYCARQCQGNCDVVGPEYECRSISGVMACVPRAGECAERQACQEDTDCPPDRFCNERAECQPGCSGDVSCPQGEVCQGLRCGPPCTGIADCPTGQTCEPDGRCRIPGGCMSSADCLEQETYCDRALMMCVGGCQVDNDCLDANLECFAGSCRERGCSGNYQCAFGQICNLATNQCEDATGAHCESGCDPMARDVSCGREGSYCISLQDRDDNPIGDFCFEPCEPEPNECPKGYSCIPVTDDMGNELGRICTTDCSLLMSQ